MGFKLEVGIFLATTQLPKLCGFAGSHGDFPAQAAHFAGHPGSIHPLSTAIGLTALLLFAGRRLFPHKPPALPLVVLGLLPGLFIDLGQLGVHTLGAFHQALPVLGVLTGLGRGDLRTLLPLAAACVLLGTVETTAIGRVLARKRAVEFKGPRQFVALAAATLAAGLAHGYPVSGGTSTCGSPRPTPRCGSRSTVRICQLLCPVDADLTVEGVLDRWERELRR